MDRIYYKCPAVYTDRQVICAITGHVLDDDLPSLQPTECDQMPVESRDQRRKRLRYEKYMLKNVQGTKFQQDDADLLKESDDRTLYSLLLLGNVDTLCWHLKFLKTWLKPDEIRLLAVNLVRLFKDKVVECGTSFFRKEDLYQIRNCIYTCVSGDRTLATQYRLFTNLERNISQILASVNPSRYNHLAL